MDDVSRAAGRVVIISGPPGAGKTTIGRGLARPPRTRGGVHIEGDRFLEAILSGFHNPWEPESADQNKTIARAQSAACFAFAGGGYFTVLDWVVGPWFLDIFRGDAARTGIALDFVLLLPSEPVAMERARDRSEAPIDDYSMLHALYAQLVASAPPGHVLDTSAMPIEATIGVVDAGLMAGRFRLE